MSARRIDDLLRASPPPPLGDAASRRLVSATLRRVALRRVVRRRRKLRAAGWTAGSAAALALIALLLAVEATPSRPGVPPARSTAAVIEARQVAPPSAAPRVARRRLSRLAQAPVTVRETFEGRITGARSPRDVARVFWEACGALEGEALASFFRVVLPRLRTGERSAIAARGRDLGEAPARVAAELGRSGVEDAWPLLAALLEARGPEPALMEAAGALGDARAVPVLRRWLCLADARAVAAASALGRIPGREALQALVSAFDASRGAGALLVPALREEVAASLERRSDELCEYLFEAASAARPVVFRALAELGTPGAVASLVRALGEPELRPLARRHLASIAKKDLGPRPEDWSRWLDGRPGAKSGKFTVRKEST
jgi:hypothetical protein